jgi:hypothetical protein
MQSDTVHRRRPVLPHAVVDVGTAVLTRFDLDLVFRLCIVRRRQVGRTAQQFRNDVEQMIERGAARGRGRWTG